MELVVLKATGTMTLAVAGAGVIKHRDAAAVLAATELLECMRQEEQAQRGRHEAALQEARHQGLREGHERAEKRSAARAAAQQLSRQQWLSQMAPVMVDLVVQALESVLRGVDRAVWLRSATDAVQDLLRRSRWARLRVHPDHVTAAQEALEAAHCAQRVSVVADAALAADACRFETDAGVADGSLPVQLDLLREVLAATVAEVLGTAP